MFGSIGGPELILIAVLALLLFGPRKLPQIGRSVGRALGEFRSATRDFKTSLEREVELEEVKQVGAELGSVDQEIRAAARPYRPDRTAATPPADPPDGEKPPQP